MPLRSISAIATNTTDLLLALDDGRGGHSDVLRTRADPSAVNLLTANDDIEAKRRVALGNA